MRTGTSTVMLVAAFVLVGALAAHTTGEPPQPTQPPGKGFPNLVEDIKATPGCLGVEVARTDSGKQVIFAWFEDRKALLKWVNGKAHQKLMKQGFPDQDFGEPLKDIPDDSGPI